MRIGLNVSFLRKPGTGIGNMTENFLRELGKREDLREHEYILYLEEDADVSFLPQNFSKRVFLPGWKRDDLPRKWLWEKFSLPEQVKEDKCEVFVSLYQSATVLPSSIRHTMIVHDIIPEIFHEYRGNFRQALFWDSVKQGIRKVDRVITVSESTKNDLVNRLRIPKEKITVAYQSIDPLFSRIPEESEVEATLKKYGLTKGYLYHGGGLEVRKNAKALLLAYKELLDTGEELPPLVVSGKVFPKENPLAFDIEGAIREFGLEGHVSLLGFVPDDDLPALYRGASAFVYPSLYEGFGLPVLEALTLGTPCLVSSRSSLPEVGGEAVLYFDPENVSDLSTKLLNLLRDEALRNRLSSAGPEQASQFRWGSFVSSVFGSLH